MNDDPKVPHFKKDVIPRPPEKKKKNPSCPFLIIKKMDIPNIPLDLENIYDHVYCLIEVHLSPPKFVKP